MFNNRDPLGEGDNAENDSETNKSFVKKVKSKVSGLLPTTLAKWFKSNSVQKVRSRDEVDDEDSFSLQPPAKRQKLPSNSAKQRAYDFNFMSTPLHNESVPVAPNFTVHQSFEEATPGPSGINSRKFVLPTVTEESPTIFQNGDKDSDSDGESTSGYSSMHRIGSKEQVSEAVEKTYTPNKSFGNRSLFNRPMSQERSLFADKDKSPQANSSVSSRLPSFNVTSFGSPNFMDRTISTQRIVNSPFYGGRTAYGGASAYSRLIKRSPEPNSALQSFVKAKSLDDSIKKNVSLSKTAKRILDGLEQFSSASEDVRKIPNPSKRVEKPEGLISKYTGANPYVLRDSRVPSNRELQVPTMSDLLKMKLKERLQDSTVSVREMATKSKCPLNTEEYKIRSNKDTSTKTTNKIKTKVSSVRQKPIETTEAPEPVKLPEVKLPITTLPSFEFKIPPPFISEKKKDTEKLTGKNDSKQSSKSENKPQILQCFSIQKETVKNTNSNEFNFSKPLVIAENLTINNNGNNFKFCKPINMKQKTDTPSGIGNFKVPNDNVSLKMKTPTKSNGEFLPVSAAKELIPTGSVMDILGNKSNLMEKFKPAEGSWECKTCLIRNSPDKTKCVACETPRNNTSSDKKDAVKPTLGFGDKFKKLENQWECGVCMIRNDSSKNKCIACESSKPSVGVAANNSAPKLTSNDWECSKCKRNNDNSKITCGSCFMTKSSIPINTNFGDKWECTTCLIRNESNKLKCAACEADKPGSITTKVSLDKFKAKEGDWECNSCMVRNGAEKTKCVCCDSLKPGTIAVESLQPIKSIPKFSFGIDTTKTNGHDFIFGINPSSKTETNNSVPPSSIFGEGAKPVAEQSTTGFTFGIPAPNGAKPLIAEIKPVTENMSEPSKEFTFGVPIQKKDSLKRTRPEDDLSEKKSDIFNNNSSINGDVKISTSSNTLTTVSKDTTTTETSLSVSSKPVFTFKNSVDEPSAKVSLLSSTETSKVATTSENNAFPFSFSAPKTTTTTNTVFSFGNQNKESNSENKAGGFSFTSKPVETDVNPPTKRTTFNFKPNGPTFGFSPAKTESSNFTVSAEVKPMFGSTSTTNLPVFSIPKSNPNVSATSSAITFGSGSANPPTFGSGSANIPSFGSGSKPPSFGSSSENTSTFGTGSTHNSAFGSTNAPAFGSGSTNTPGFGSPSINTPAFGSTAPTVPAFGSGSTNTPAFGAGSGNTPAFGAGSGNTPAFGSGSTNTPAFGSTNAAAFGNMPTTVSNPPMFSSSSAFSLPTQAPINGGFNFGSNATTTPKTGFNFGASPAQPTFNFGASSNTQSTSGGFNFGSAAAPTFNADNKPSFNFTAGAAPTTFKAKPKSGVEQHKGRVIRKALRRTQ